MEACLFELRSQCPVVVNFTIKDDREFSGAVEHRLGCVRGEIDDRETPVCQTDEAVVGNPSSGAVGSAG